MYSPLYLYKITNKETSYNYLLDTKFRCLSVGINRMGTCLKLPLLWSFLQSQITEKGLGIAKNRPWSNFLRVLEKEVLQVSIRWFISCLKWNFISFPEILVSNMWFSWSENGRIQNAKKCRQIFCLFVFGGVCVRPMRRSQENNTWSKNPNDSRDVNAKRISII